MAFLQQPLFPPQTSWRAPRLSELPPDWNKARRVAVDVETCDPSLKKLGIGVRRGGYIVGYSFALEGEGRGWYVPLRHLGGGNVEDPAAALRYLREQARTFRGEIVGAKLDYDLDYLAEEAVEFPLVSAFRDVQVAEPLLDELQFSYSLDNILGRYGLPGKDEELLRRAAAEYGLDPKSELWKLPGNLVGEYGEADALRPLQLLAQQEKLIVEQDLQKVWDLESAVLPVLVKMRRRGVRIDTDQLDKVERWSQAEEMKAWGEIARATGIRVKLGDAMKADVLAPVLQSIGVSVPVTAKTRKPSITKDWLAEIDHPVAGHIRRARQVSQLRSTFVNSIREHMVQGRIHCTFNQLKRQKDEEKDETEGAAYGRLSCSDPNLQQQPARDPEIGPMWRAIYIPDTGGMWGQLDYSQQEPRMLLHWAVKAGPNRLTPHAHAKAMEMARQFREDPSTDNHTAFTKMVHGDDVVGWADFKKKRDECKQIFLGLCYEMGGPKLCHKLGLPTKVIEHWKTGRKMEVAGDEGQALLDKVNERVPYIKLLSQDLQKVAKARGYVKTISGRRCRFPKDEVGNFDWTHKALNRIIQGGSADQTKIALVEMDRAGLPLQLQVHDEIDLTVDSWEMAERGAEIMEQCVPLEVPSKVDAECGPNWGNVSGKK